MVLLDKVCVVKGPAVPTVVPELNCPPAKVQAELLVDDQSRVVVVPVAMDEGVAVKEVMTGGGPTVTVVLWLAEPPGPAQVTL